MTSIDGTAPGHVRTGAPLREPDRTQRIDVGDGVELHALRWDGGDRRPFVLVHGLASNAHLWDGVAGHLAAGGHPVLSLDQRGHGRSSKPDSGYDMASVAEDLRAVVEASGFDRPVVAGQSWGGNVVVELAARHPGLTAGAVAVDGGTIDLRSRFASWDEARSALAPPMLAGTPLADLERFMREGHPDWPESGIRGALACFEVRGDGTVAPWLTRERHLMVLRGLWDHRPGERYASITEPVLLLVAETGDPRWDDQKAEGVRAAEAGLRAVRTVWIRGHHDLHAQHPAEVARLLDEACDDLFLAADGSR